jgi:hypothetical protein
MITDNQICLGVLVGTNSETKYYVQVPIACQIQTVRATSQNSDIGDGDLVTIKDGVAGNTIGVATFGTGIAAGAKATYEANSTYGNQDLEINDVLEIVITALNAAGDRVFVQIELDPYALS